MGFVKRQNEKYHFTGNLIKKIGYPYWDKSIVIRPEGGATHRVSSDTINTVFIPFVLDSQNVVRTTLVVNASPADTNFHFIADWQYRNRRYGSPESDTTAENIALLFMSLDKNVFGYNRFLISDSNLFKINNIPLGNYKKELRLNSSSNRSSSLQRALTVTTVCIYSYYCGTPNGGICGPNASNCDYLRGCSVGVCYSLPTQCYSYEVNGDPYPPPTGGGGSPGGGGSGSGSGGGWPPPEYPLGPEAKVSTLPGCPPGWNPPPIIIYQQVPEPIDSMLAKYSRAMNTMTDSIYTLSMASNVEWAHILVKNANDAIYPKNPKTDNLPTSVKQNRTVSSGEVIIAEVHIHPDTATNSMDRDGPSGDDLWGLRSNLRDRYTLFVDVGDEKFALVIENVDSAQAFFNARSLSKIQSLHDSIPLTITTPSWFSNWRNATTQSLKQIMGSSTSCGIGFYKSSNSQKTLFTKLNP